MPDNSWIRYFAGKRVLLTGHTGFKGAWLSAMLINAGAKLTGYALAPPTNPNLYELAALDKKMQSVIADIRDFDTLKKTFEQTKPQVVFHLAAQPIVRESYKYPRYTYETNVMGTVNLLECVRTSDSVESVLNVTTDKVYKNNEWEWGYRENEPLDGYDPYSNSKSCSELVTHSYRSAFFADTDVRVSTARAGNVIGGGDFAIDRIIPDSVRAAMNNEKIIVRNPCSIRPYQHVLEPLLAYMMIAAKQCEDVRYADYYNVGPDEADCVSTGELVDLFCACWGEELTWINQNMGGPHEASFLRLDCSKLKKTFDWKPIWRIADAVQKTVDWTKAYMAGADIYDVLCEQIDTYMQELKH